MAWPKPTDYIEAIQNPRLNLGDEELRAGQPALSPMGMPLLWSGNFAQVFKIDCPASNNTWALKCFTREVPGLQYRYREVAAHLDRAKLPFTVEFKYLEQGIRVAGEWFPAVKMRWVEGQTLNAFVEQYLDKPKTLDLLLDLWVKLSTRLREAEVAHADLQHGNVLLVPMPGGQLALRLIDYDGMWVPRLAGTPSAELGHPDFQHPQRLDQGTYNAQLDRFSHLVIYAAIRSLRAGRRELWERFNNGQNLLFRESDFLSPGASGLFRSLWGLKSHSARAAVGHLVMACQVSLEQVPLLEELVVNGRVRALSLYEQAAVENLLCPSQKATGVLLPKTETVFDWPLQADEAQVRRLMESSGLPSDGQLPLDAAPQEEEFSDFFKEVLHDIASQPETGTRVVAHEGTLPVQATTPASQPERQSIASQLLALAAAPIQAWDELLLRVTGADNGILHGFLHLMMVAFLVAAVAIGCAFYQRLMGIVVCGAAIVVLGTVGFLYYRQWRAEMAAARAELEESLLYGLDLGNGVQIEFVWVAPGQSMMGDDAGEPCERPSHRLFMNRPYWMAKYQVTQEQWEALMSSNPSKFKGPQNPIESVTWHDCQEFLRRLNEKYAVGGFRFSLPTEAQWEYACRAGSSTSYSFGHAESQLDEYAWYDKNSLSTHPVGEKQPNAWGLYDMHGNVWEWCAEWFDVTKYDRLLFRTPIDFGDAEIRLNRVLRGGSWFSKPFNCRSASRMGRKPESGDDNIGCRVVCLRR